MIQVGCVLETIDDLDAARAGEGSEVRLAVVLAMGSNGPAGRGYILAQPLVPSDEPGIFVLGAEEEVPATRCQMKLVWRAKADGAWLPPDQKRFRRLGSMRLPPAVLPVMPEAQQILLPPVAQAGPSSSSAAASGAAPNAEVTAEKARAAARAVARAAVLGKVMMGGLGAGATTVEAVSLPDGSSPLTASSASATAALPATASAPPEPFATSLSVGSLLSTLPPPATASSATATAQPTVQPTAEWAMAQQGESHESFWHRAQAVMLGVVGVSGGGGSGASAEAADVAAAVAAAPATPAAAAEATVAAKGVSKDEARAEGVAPARHSNGGGEVDTHALDAADVGEARRDDRAAPLAHHPADVQPHAHQRRSERTGRQRPLHSQRRRPIA